MSLIRFGVNQPVPVNLLMMGVLIAGFVAASTLRREFFPEIEPEAALVTMPYPGAAPEEIEQTLAIKVEDKLIDLDEIKEIRTTLTEGGGGLTVELREGVDADKAIDEIERAIDSLLDLPEESERIQVQLFEPRMPVIRVVLVGDLDEHVMKQAIRRLRDDLRTLPNMGEALIEGVRDYEIRVDVQREAMWRQGVSLPEIAERIKHWMRDYPGGTVRTTTGDVKVRTMGVLERADQIRDIVIRSDEQSRVVRLGDIAQVSDSFVDERIITRFNGKSSVGLTVFKIGDQDIVNIAEMVRAYTDGRKGEAFIPQGLRERLALRMTGDEINPDDPLVTDRMRAWRLGAHSPYPLPAGVELATNADLARFVEGRLDLLTRNALYGGVLVFLTLLLFLNWRVAMWVGAGLVTALMGTLVLMSIFDITLNLLTMFGLIVVLGLLVDDAIVVSENIQTRHDRGESALSAAVAGAREVLWPVVATVMTSVVAFLPLRFIRGQIGDLLGALPMVVACALIMSLFESVLILPSHMGHSLAKRDRSHPGRFVQWIRRAEKYRDHLIFDRLAPLYAKLLTLSLHYRYISVATAVAVLMVSLGMYFGGRVDFTFLQDSDAETIVVDLRMPVGASIERTNEAVAKIEHVARSKDEVLYVSSVVGQRSNIDTGAAEAFAPHVAQMFIELKFVEDRDRTSDEVIDEIRQELEDQLDEVDRMSFAPITGGPGGADISIRIAGKEMDQVLLAVTRIKQMLDQQQGLYDVADDSDLGQLELQVNVRPDALAQGFNTEQIAKQLRGYLYGVDAHVYASQEEDIDVRVRVDEGARRSLFAIENSWVISPQGDPVPLSEIADIVEAQTYATIKRIDRKRTVTVTADTHSDVNPEGIVSAIKSPNGDEPSPIDRIRQAFPQLEITFAGRQENLADAMGTLPYGFLAALLMVYVILAWLFSNYVQPIIVLLAVPFAIIGVIWGHLLLGYQMTFLSLIGFVALSGIVVNDSLILIKFYNSKRLEGVGVMEGLVAAGRARLRAILLTTITTVFGLLPLLLEQSFQARFLIPMAISIAMGLIASTVLILLVLPCFVMLFADLKRLATWVWMGGRTMETEASASTPV